MIHNEKGRLFPLLHFLSLSLSLSPSLKWTRLRKFTRSAYLSVIYTDLTTFLCNPCYVSIKDKELHRPSRRESKDRSVASRKLLPPLTNFPSPLVPFRQFGFPLYLHSAIRKRFTSLPAGIRHMEGGSV